MRNIFLALCLSALVLSGCSKSPQDPAQRAKELLSLKGIPAPQFSRMDSLFGYSDVFKEQIEANLLEMRKDSLTKVYYREQSLSEHRDDLLFLNNTVYKMRTNTAKTELTRRMEHAPKEFVGYSAVIADSLSDDMIEILLDKDMEHATYKRIKL